MEILFIIVGGFLIALILGFQISVCKKYLFEYAKTKVDETRKTITIKNKVIPFSEINEVYVYDVPISMMERFFVSVMFFYGVSGMKLVLNDGTSEIVILPKNYILAFRKQMKSAGVKIRETW
jgi:hypothetical protein